MSTPIWPSSFLTRKYRNIFLDNDASRIKSHHYPYRSVTVSWIPRCVPWQHKSDWSKLSSFFIKVYTRIREVKDDLQRSNVVDIRNTKAKAHLGLLLAYKLTYNQKTCHTSAISYSLRVATRTPETMMHSSIFTKTVLVFHTPHKHYCHIKGSELTMLI